jgi:hypothetical protein
MIESFLGYIYLGLKNTLELRLGSKIPCLSLFLWGWAKWIEIKNSFFRLISCNSFEISLLILIIVNEELFSPKRRSIFDQTQ